MMTEMKDQKELITYTELGKLTNACLKLLSHVDKLSEGNDDRMSDIAGNILGSLRKLLVATTLYKRQVICIAGLQGAGKTTLMRYFYDLDDTLVGTIGVGERVPVLITERKDIRRPMLYSIKIIRKGEEYLEIREEINPKDYETQTHASNESIMYFELFVPFKFIKDSNDDSACFMLLPGHEVEKGDKYYLNNLIEFSVNSSDAAVFVLNQTRLSYEENQTYMRNVEKKFHNQIVYVISQSETTEDDNASTKKTLMDEYAIPDRRIVCYGG